MSKVPDEVGVGFYPDHSEKALVYIEHNGDYVRAFLDRDEVWQLVGMGQRAVREMDWHQATWVYATLGSFGDTYHLMHKGEHDEKGRPICGQGLSKWRTTWSLSPVIGEPWLERCCKRCLAAYDKNKEAIQS